jgi:hypothetical protein
MVAALIRSAESLFFKYLAGPGVSALLKGVGKLTRSFSPYQLGRAKGARALGERQSARGAPERVRAVLRSGAEKKYRSVKNFFICYEGAGK